MPSFLALSAVVLLRAAPAPAPATAPATAAIAHPVRLGIVDDVEKQVVDSMRARDAAGLVALFSEAMRNALPVAKAGPFLEGVLAAKGPIRSIERAPGSTGTRSAEYIVHAEKGDWRLKLSVDDSGKVLGLNFGEPPAAEPAVAKSTLPLALPFTGKWLVFWGGDTLDKNQHVPHHSQRRAADLVVVDDDGRTHRGEGSRVEDFYAYGKDVLASADGVVVTVVDGIPDNLPGHMDRYFVPGNTVILRHGDEVYSMVGHLIPASIRVKVGQTVKRGEVLGRCGNSGNSSEPHLHFQMQDGARFDSSWGIEAHFGQVKTWQDKKASTVVDYTFNKGDIVEPSR